MIAPSALYSVQAPTHADVDRVAAMILGCDMAAYGEPDYSLDDLRHAWESVDLARDAWLVETPTGQLVGYGMVRLRRPTRANGHWYSHPEAEQIAVGHTLAQRIEARAREMAVATPADQRVVLRQEMPAQDEAARQVLAANGYTRVRLMWRMQTDFTEPPPAPQWPAGIRVRPFVLGQDDRVMYETVTEAFQDHWGTTSNTYETWRAQNIELPTFDPSLWFLAFEGDTAAGAMMCSTFMDLGWVDNLSVRRPWRKHGLGMALLRHAFAMFYAQGRSGVSLAVDSESVTGATRLYERAGMRVVRQFAVYEKEVRPALGLE